MWHDRPNPEYTRHMMIRGLFPGTVLLQFDTNEPQLPSFVEICKLTDEVLDLLGWEKGWQNAA